MDHSMQRREFIRKAGLAAALTGAAAAAASTGALAEAGLAPPQALTAATKSVPRFFSGCCAYSFRKYLQHGPMTMEDFLRQGVALDLAAVDMTGYYFKSMSPDYLAGLRHMAFKLALSFSGTACGVSMVQADAGKRAQALSEIKKWIDAADLLGASHLRIFAGKLPAVATEAQGVDWVVEIMKPACDYSAPKGITLGLEDHSGISQSASVCLEIMRRVDSPYAAINLDITHFVPEGGQDAYAQIAACVPYATVAHVREVFDDGTPIDMDRVWKIFRSAGFKGYMSAEYEGPEDPMTGVPKLTAKIKSLNKKYSSV